MFKYLLLLLLVTHLFSNENQVENQNLEEFSKEKKEKILKDYTKALLFYKQKNYQQAYKDFNALFESNLDDVNINFYLGRSAFELKKFDEAIIAYERVLFSKPESLRTKLEIGRAFFMTKQFNEASKYFKEVQNDPKTPPKIQEALNKFFTLIDQSKQKHFLTGVVLVGLNYDSNVNNRSEFDQFNIPVFNTPLTNTTQGDSAVAHQEVLIVNHKYNLGDTEMLKNDLLLFNKSMFQSKHRAKEVKLLSYTPAYSKIYENGITVDYALFADALWIEDDSNLRTYGIFPKLTYLYSDEIILDGYLKYQDKNFQKVSDENKDSQYTELQLGGKYRYSDKVTYGASVVITTERKDGGSLTNVDKDSYQIKLNNTYIYSKSISLAPTISYKQTKNKQSDPLNLVKQKDDEYKIGVIGTYIYSPKVLFQLGADHTDVSSNIQSSDYKKHTFTFNFIRPF